MDSAEQFLDAPRDGATVSFLDATTLDALEKHGGGRTPTGPVIVFCDKSLQTPVGWLAKHEWLSHVISTHMLEQPYFAEHLKNVLATLTSGRKPRLLEWLDPSVVGRRVRLAQASKRASRLERMTEYLESRGVGSRTIEQLRDAAEELLTNAFYDAPCAAGAVPHAISRTLDVSLSEDSACDMVYGSRDDLAFIRVRDPFGSLTRARLVEVLGRCARSDMQVQVDESMGGAGLGLWRIFTVATFVAVSVVPNRHTEFLVGIGKKTPGARPYAFHLFFKEQGRAVRRWKMLDATTSRPELEKSITIVNK